MRPFSTPLISAARLQSVFPSLASLFLFVVGLAALPAYGQEELSIDKFTGTAQLSIPLYSLPAGAYAFPIGLSHVASGVKVSDAGGLVGVNWSLNAEPRISREVRGLPDDINLNSGSEQRYGWLVAGVAARASLIAPVNENAGACSADEQQAYTGITGLETTANGVHTLYDSEPDIYSYSLPGFSGKFLLTPQGQVHLLPFAPLLITCNRGMGNDPTIVSFTIRTPTGIQCQLTYRDRRTVKSTPVGSTVKYFSKDCRAYATPLSFTAAWRAQYLTTPAGQRIDFQYRFLEDEGGTPTPVTSSKKWFTGYPADTAPVEEYKTETTESIHWLTKMVSSSMLGPSMSVDFVLASGVSSDVPFYLTGIRVYDLRQSSELLVKEYTLQYRMVSPLYYDSRLWKDEYGTQITDVGYYHNRRRFLASISESKNCAITTLYAFGYAGVKTSTTTLPPLNCAEQDYWGYYNGNRADKLMPKLYVGLDLDPKTVPGAPYRLFPLTSGNWFELAGADRRPAQSQSATGFAQYTLAGTLTSITYATGGQSLLEFEPHQVVDGVTALNQYGGGARVKSITIRDNVRQVAQKKEYQYTLTDGTTSSGRFLTLPRFAFLHSGTSTYLSLVEQTSAVTVRSGEELAPDPYEFRAVGYAQVTERTNGKGRAVHTFTIAATADQFTHSSGWLRPSVGVARTSQGTCPSTNFYRIGKDVFPFPPAPELSARQGLVESTRLDAEDGSGGFTPVQLNAFAYDYKIMAAAPTVPAVAYETLAIGSGTAFAYAVYTAPPSVLVTTATESHTTYNQQRPTQGITTSTQYEYNARGYLATVLSSAQNGKRYRTRYKYGLDFPSNGGAASPEYAALQKRTITEGIQNEPIETATEVVDDAGNPLLTSLMLVTFADVNSKTVPNQIKAWSPAAPVPVTTRSAGGYDPTAVVNNPQSGKQDLVYDSRLRTLSTVVLTDAQLSPITSYATKGNALEAVHLGYRGTLPILRISQAAADQVVFTDFETDSDYQFAVQKGANITPVAARTGRKGYTLNTDANLSAALPPTAPAACRLTFWARGVAGATSINVAIKQGTTTVWQANPITVAPVKWTLIDLPVDLTALGAGRIGYQLVVTGTAATAVDDVTFLPALALASSTTYDLAQGRTSETDARGRTTYFEYDLAGDLHYVRDHNLAIVKQLTQSVPGRRIIPGQPFIQVSGDLMDGRRVDFRAITSCVEGAQYAWNFGDPSSGTANTATGANPNHTFNTGDLEKEYKVALTTTMANGQSTTLQLNVYIVRTIADITVEVCAKGLMSVDLCDANYTYKYGNGCDNSGNAAGSLATQYVAQVTAPSCPGNTTYNYEWQMSSKNAVTWTTMQNSASPLYSVGYARTRGTYRVRCIVTSSSCNRNKESEPFTFNHNGNQGCQ